MVSSNLLGIISLLLLLIQLNASAFRLKAARSFHEPLEEHFNVDEDLDFRPEEIHTLGSKMATFRKRLSGDGATVALRQIVYEVLHCMRPCLNNGITLLPRNTVDMCRCICPPVNYGLACEFEITEEEKRHRGLL